MKLLLHVCCGPCATFPLSVLRREGIDPVGFFFNPNIHPFREFQKRLEALEKFAGMTGMEIEIGREYGLREFLRGVVHHEDDRCSICYEMRLRATAARAKDLGAESFSTTLLYSRYQKHESIRRIGEAVAGEYGIDFHYRDFRGGWQEGIDMAIGMELYRQPYCGCIYSEEERYNKSRRFPCP